MKKISILFFVLCSTILSAQEEILLRLDYKKGDVYEITMKMKQDMGNLMNSVMVMEMKQEITESNKEDYLCTMKIRNIKMDVFQGEKVQSYDSTKEVKEEDVFANQMKQALGGMLDANIFVKGNFLGEALEVKIEPNFPGMQEMMASNESIIYPKEKIKVGGTWSMTKNQQGIKMNFTYTVKEINQEFVFLNITGDTSGLATGEISGKMKLDREDGVPVDSTITIDMETAGQKIITSVEMVTKKK